MGVMINLLTEDQRGRMAEKFMDLGNIAVGALLFSQAFSGFNFDWRLASIGLVFLALMYVSALLVFEIGNEKGGGIR